MTAPRGRPYVFYWKPGDERRPPPWVAPYHPRLDWQMWFAALSDASSDRWVLALARRLLEGSPPVRALLAPGPWSDHPPRYIRATLYDYRFTDWTTGRAERRLVDARRYVVVPATADARR